MAVAGYVKIASTAWTFKREISIVAISLLVLISLPILATVGLLSNGVAHASDKIVSVDTTTHKVTVRNFRGEIVTELTATTAWPIKGVVTQEFGDPNPPYQIAHSGIDIDGGNGSDITVFMAGKVLKTGSFLPGCGSHCVQVDHGFGISSVYAHMSNHFVQVGQDVKPSDVIGKQGEEGWAHGSHLHFEIRVGNLPVNPRLFMVGNPPQRG